MLAKKIRSMIKIQTLEELQTFTAKNVKTTIATFEHYAQEGAKLKPIEKIFGNYVLDNSLVHFPAKRGSGKSLLCLQLCLAITHRYSEFIGEPITKHGKCIFFDFEMSPWITQRRAFQLKKHAPIYLQEFSDDLIIYNTRNSFIEDFDQINRLIYENKPILIVIDNLRNCIKNANTNSGQEMGNFFGILNGLKQIHKFSVIIVDHLRKHTDNIVNGSSDLQSGSGIKSDLSDADFLLRNSSIDKDLRLMKRIKSRMTEESDKVKLIKLNPATLWFELIEEDVNEADHIGISQIQDKEELKDRAFDMHEKGMTLEEIAKILNKSKSTIHRYINQKKQ